MPLKAPTENDSAVEWLTIDECAIRLRVGYKTIWTAIQKKKLTAYRVLGSYRVKPSDLDQWLEKCRTVKRQEIFV